MSPTDLRSPRLDATPNGAAAGDTLGDGHRRDDTHFANASPTLSPDHRNCDAHGASVGANANGHGSTDAHTSRAVGEDLGGHTRPDTHAAHAPSDNGQCPSDAHGGHAVVGTSWDAYDHLGFLADSLDDLEEARKAAFNRYRALIDDKGIGEGEPEAKRLHALAEGLLDLEKVAVKALKRDMRAHPLAPFVKSVVGVGDKQMARLLAAIGDPLRWVDSETGEVHERTVSQLWAYCGHGDIERSRRVAGQKLQHNPTAKMRVRLVADSCKRQMHSPFRRFYDREREKWAHRDTSDGHKDNHALRVMGKEILKAVYNAARDLERAEMTVLGHRSRDTQRLSAELNVGGHAQSVTHTRSASSRASADDNPVTGRVVGTAGAPEEAAA